MGRQDDIEAIRRQEAEIAFSRFDEDEAFRLGTRLRELAVARVLPIVIDVRTWDRHLFFCALPGSTAANADWVRRKVNVVRRFSKSTYRMVLEQDSGDLFSPRHGLDPADYVLAGGGFPIHLSNAGVVGAVTISGLPQRDDHALVVEALCGHLGLEVAALALAVE